jgi:hypothetical protein
LAGVATATNAITGTNRAITNDGIMVTDTAAMDIVTVATAITTGQAFFSATHITVIGHIMVMATPITIADPR